MSKAFSTTKKVPGNFLSEPVKIHKDLIWENIRPKIKRSTLIADYDRGGRGGGGIKILILNLKFSL